MKNFNEITLADERAAVAKFKEFDRGVNMSRFATNDSTNESKWGELVNEKSFSNRVIQNKMIEIGNRINNQVQNDMLGDTTVAFTFTGTRGKRVKFTHLELYTFLRAALRERKESAEYLAKVVKAKELNTFIEANKSTDAKLADAVAALAALKAEDETILEEA